MHTVDTKGSLYKFEVYAASGYKWELYPDTFEKVSWSG